MTYLWPGIITQLWAFIQIIIENFIVRMHNIHVSCPMFNVQCPLHTWSIAVDPMRPIYTLIIIILVLMLRLYENKK